MFRPWYQPIEGGIIVYILSEWWKPYGEIKRLIILRWMGLVAAVAFPSVYFLKVYDQSLPLMFYPILCSLLVFAASLPAPAELPGTSLMAWLGRRSYGLYLSHLPCGMIVREAWYAVLPVTVKPDFITISAVYVSWAVTTFGITELLHRFVEKPLMEYGRREKGVITSSNLS
jgi:peptidoglycan/LPS O-acetylase OafA/YrhL